MGLFRSIPLNDTQLPFLKEVDFTTLGENLATARQVNAQRSKAGAAADALTMPADKKQAADALIRQFPNIVGMNEWLEKLRLDLGPSGSNSVFITGPREGGKTTLVELLVRTRAEGRLSSQLGTKPFYILDSTSFFAETPQAERVGQFKKALDAVSASNGMLIIDHVDDFVQMAGNDSTLLLNMLVSRLERNSAMHSIIVAEETAAASVHEASGSVQRKFKPFALNKEPGLDELKPILMSTAVKLEREHNLKYSEEALDEVVRLLSRYPGRAFTDARPGNAIQLADMTGGFVRRNLYAEPRKLTEMREKLTKLQDEYCVLQGNGHQERLAKLATDIAALSEQQDRAEKEWRDKFKGLNAAQKLFATIETELPKLRLKRPPTPEEKARITELEGKPEHSIDELKELTALKAIQPRTAAEDKKFDLYSNNYEKAKADVTREEQKLYQSLAVVKAEHVRTVFNSQASIAARSAAETRARLRNLEPFLDSQIVKQSEAKQALANAYRAREEGTKDPSRPTVILFAGGSGLGKTELVKVLTRYDFGLEDRLDLADQVKPVTLSLSQFSDKSSVAKLEGSTPGTVGYDDIIPWHEDLRKNPRNIFFLDEGDKAHPSVFLHLMQVMDDGSLKDNHQREISFKDVIVCVAINGITADDIPLDKRDDRNFIIQKICEVESESGGKLFTKAIANRFDFICIFENLAPADLVPILHKGIRKLNNDFKDKGVTVTLDNETARKIVDAHPIPEAGGRAPSKIIEGYIRPTVGTYVRNRDDALDAAGKIDIVSKDTLRIVIDDENKISVQLVDGPQPSQVIPAVPAATTPTAQPS